MKLLQWIKEHRVFFDGGMGSLLQERGLKPGELPETGTCFIPKCWWRFIRIIFRPAQIS